ncbi:MAG TPA: hypothetical protein VFU97_15795 [Xanthobacteraceae bacterium]|nr:hypothetical protein [Xanthobacteraceae bacterium]
MAVVGAHDLDAELELAGDLDRPGAVAMDGSPIAAAAALASSARRSTAGSARRAGGGAPADLGDQLGPELVALAGGVAQAQAKDLDAEHRRPSRGRGAHGRDPEGFA